ncbi:MAG: GNAT family N-acetyltransferase [Candidatus Riflebacteria bacterium]|nr:GNAT family N-acetyltransferase [Candidatus Riflebacteria bacterium]
MNNEVLQSKRIKLRAFQKADFIPFRNMNADPRVMEHFLNPLSAEESDKFADRIIQRMDADGYGLWAVEQVDDSKFIGFCGLSSPNFQTYFTPCVEIGWRLSFDAWGHGYATEAALAVLDLGFTRFKFPEIVSFTATTNNRSEKVMQKIGMKKIGEFQHPRISTDHLLCQHVLYKITVDEFKQSVKREYISPLTWHFTNMALSEHHYYQNTGEIFQ